VRLGFPMALWCSLLATPGCAQSGDGGAELIPKLERLAARNDAEAIYYLGMAYQTGSRVPRDPVKALAEFRRAAALGDPLASYKLGCYFDGQDTGLVERDPEQAIATKRVAAEAGYALAQADLAALYHDKGDTASATAWIARAAAQGWPEALRSYGLVLNGAAGGLRQPAKAAAYLRIFTRTSVATDEDRAHADALEKELTPGERAAELAIIDDFQPKPTPLTWRGLSGERAAIALVEGK